jgi:taurine dioxygenase
VSKSVSCAAPIAFEPISGACGAVASGADLRNPLSLAVLGVIEQALKEHLILVFPGQSLTATEQARFTRRLGAPSPVPFIQPVAEHPDVILVARGANEPPSFDPAGGWHSDFSFLPEPPSYTVLQAVDVPPFGGDTLWANQYLAYAALTPKLRSLLGQLDGVHSAEHAFAPELQVRFDALAEASVVTGPEAFEREVHPLVIAHPVSGRPSLYVNAEYTVGLDGLTPQEAGPLLDFLGHHSIRHEFTCRWRWSPGDLAVWDNRCLQHMAMPDYKGHARRMLRTTVQGSRPVPGASLASEDAQVGRQTR